MKRGRYAPLFLWMIGIFGFLIALGEALLRWYAPEMSYRFMQLSGLEEFADIPTAGIIEKVSFRPGDQLSTYCGLIGTGLMIIAAIYPIFRRIKLFRWLASNTMWFDFHLMAGTVGPMFIALHSVLRLNSWVSAAFWSMIIVVVSGVLGRYLYTQVPDLLNGRELEELDHQRAFQKAPDPELPMAEIIASWPSTCDGPEGRGLPSVLRALCGCLPDIGRTRARWRQGPLAQLQVDRKTLNDLARRAARMIVIARDSRRTESAAASSLWKKVHVPFTILLTASRRTHLDQLVTCSW